MSSRSSAKPESNHSKASAETVRSSGSVRERTVSDDYSPTLLKNPSSNVIEERTEEFGVFLRSLEPEKKKPLTESPVPEELPTLTSTERIETPETPGNTFMAGNLGWEPKRVSIALTEPTAVDENEPHEQTPDSDEGGYKLYGIPKVPPQQIPGYEFEAFLGHGAYGEVWTAIQVSTFRRVAVKFYTHHDQDLTSLTREVEKLSLLFSDQNVVQLLEVGWNAEVPYYIMEYLENGSLADSISRKELTFADSEEIFGTLLHAMLRAHQKGIIHCDLKPGNILMDQNGNLRIADFGQSRLSNEMLPALGTLFYMPPEQTLRDAHPDVRWDVYALGAIFYAMLTGHPPHYTPYFVEKIQEKHHLSSRLNLYRQLILERPIPSELRQMRELTLPMAQIIEKCLQPIPENRFQSLEELLEEWTKCQKQRDSFPILLVGIVMPILLLILGSFFGFWEFQSTLKRGREVLTNSAFEAGCFAAEAVAKNVESELARRHRVVSQLAENWQFREMLQNLESDSEWLDSLKKLGDSSLDETQLQVLQKNFTANPKRKEMQDLLEKLMPKGFQMEAGDDLIFCDSHGIFCTRIPFGGNLGQNFMPYLMERKKLKPGEPFVTESCISEVYPAPTTGQWAVAIITPVFSTEEKPTFLGILFMGVSISNFISVNGETSDHFVTLVDQRPGEMEGLILEHPLYNQLLQCGIPIPESFMNPKYRISGNKIPNSIEKGRYYMDPMSTSALANGQFHERWIAACADVNLDLGNGGHWTVITQKSYNHVIGSLFTSLERHFWYVYGIAAMAFIIIIPSVWYIIYRKFILVAGRR